MFNITGAQYEMTNSLGDTDPRGILVGIEAGDDAKVTVTHGILYGRLPAEIGVVAGSTGQVTVSGSESSWRGSNPVYIGKEGQGTLQIENAALFSVFDGVQIGYASSGEGTAIVTGADSLFSYRNGYIGFEGKGTLRVENGAKASSSVGFGYIGEKAGSEGEIIVTGAGSVLEGTGGNSYVGNYGKGTLKIIDGASAVVSGQSLGKRPGGEGYVIVSGENSLLETELSLNIGYEGKGDLKIENGGKVASERVFVARQSDSEGALTITGPGSSLSTIAECNIGISGAGMALIENGGRVTVRTFGIGSGSGSEGNVTVRGSNSRIDSLESFAVGSNGYGILNIQAGGRVSSGTGNVGQRDGTGEVTVTGVGSMWEIANDLVLGGTTIVNASEGAALLRVENRGRVDADGTLMVHPGGTITGHAGTIVGNIINNGNISPGNSPGLLTFGGSYTQSAGGALNIELGGLLQGTEYDRLSIFGTAQLGGSLNVSLFDDFVLGDNQSFEILTATGGVSGSFAGLADGAIVGTFGGYHLHVDYGINNVRLVTQPVPEPTTVALLLTGAFLVSGSRRVFRRTV